MYKPVVYMHTVCIQQFNNCIEIDLYFFRAPELAKTHRQNQDQTLPTRGLKELLPTRSWVESKETEAALEERKTLLNAERIEKG